MKVKVTDITAAEAAYGITLTDEEKRLLTAAPGLLDHREHQQGYILAISLLGMECPACLSVTCRRAAAKDGLSLTGVNPDDAYECPKCGTRLVYNVAALGGEQFFTIHPSEARPLRKDPKLAGFEVRDTLPLGSEVLHEHEFQRQKLRHGHPGGDQPHGYFEHPEDGQPS